MRRFVSFLLLILPNIVLPQNINDTTPAQRFFDWTNLQFDKSVYANRRAKLIQTLKNSGGGSFWLRARMAFPMASAFASSMIFSTSLVSSFRTQFLQLTLIPVRQFFLLPGEMPGSRANPVQTIFPADLSQTIPI